MPAHSGLLQHLSRCTVLLIPLHSLFFAPLQWRTSTPDPLHDFVEDLAIDLSKECGTDVVVYIELDRFLADLSSFNRAVFVEPIVLYGSKQAEHYLAVKQALKRVPHVTMRMPTNSSMGVQLSIIEDL